MAAVRPAAPDPTMITSWFFSDMVFSVAKRAGCNIFITFMRKPILLASFFVILCLSRPGLALDLYPDFGPLETRTQNPLTLLFLSPVPENASVLDRGHSRF